MLPYNSRVYAGKVLSIILLTSYGQPCQSLEIRSCFFSPGAGAEVTGGAIAIGALMGGATAIGALIGGETTAGIGALIGGETTTGIGALPDVP
jgi:hypothetical protein